MPLARYFLLVGGALLALLFVADAALPKLTTEQVATTQAAADLTSIRIRSDRKWPERIVFDTSVPAMVVASQAPEGVLKTEASVPAPAIPAIPATARLREAFAQLTPSDPVTPEVKPVQPKRKVAKKHKAPPVMLFAQQQQPFGFFGNQPHTW